MAGDIDTSGRTINGKFNAPKKPSGGIHSFHIKRNPVA